MQSLTDGSYSCFDRNIILKICDLWERDASGYFLDNVLIRYSSCKEKSILDNRNIYFGSNLKYSLLEKYGGVKCTRIVITDKNRSDVIGIINNEIRQGRPIGGLLDAFDCCWNAYFHKAHRPHAVLIIQYDKKMKEYVCLDEYLTRDKQHICINDLNGSLYRIYVLTKIEDNENIQEANIRKILQESLNGVQGYSVLDGLYNMYNDLLRIEYFENDMRKYNDLSESFFLLRLRQVEWNMMTIANVLLNRTGNKDSILKNELAEKFLQQVLLWKKILWYLSKAYYSKNLNVNFYSMAETIKEIISSIAVIN